MAKCAASGGMVDISALSIEEPEEQPAGWRNRQTQGLKSLRLLEDADIYQTANNCRTGMEMIEKYYAAHLKKQLDAAAINIMRPCPRKKAISKEGPGRVGAAAWLAMWIFAAWIMMRLWPISRGRGEMADAADLKYA